MRNRLARATFAALLVSGAGTLWSCAGEPSRPEETRARPTPPAPVSTDSLAPAPIAEEARLTSKESVHAITGTVVKADDDTPVSGARVDLWLVTTREGGPLKKTERAEELAREPVEVHQQLFWKGRENALVALVTTATDAAGQFRFVLSPELEERRRDLVVTARSETARGFLAGDDDGFWGTNEHLVRVRPVYRTRVEVEGDGRLLAGARVVARYPSCPWGVLQVMWGGHHLYKLDSGWSMYFVETGLPRMVSFDDDWIALSSITDAAGTATFESPGKLVVLEATAEGFAKQSLKVNPAEAPVARPVRITLVHEATSQGRVLDPDGHPVAGVHVRALSTDGVTRALSEATDASGHFEIPHLESGRSYAFWPYVDDDASFVSSGCVAVVPKENAEIVLGRAASLTVELDLIPELAKSWPNEESCLNVAVFREREDGWEIAGRAGLAREKLRQPRIPELKFNTLRPGRYLVKIEAGYFMMHDWMPEGVDPTPVEPFELVAGRETHKAVPLRKARCLVGRAISSARKPQSAGWAMSVSPLPPPALSGTITGITVDHWGNELVWVGSGVNEDGKFCLSPVPWQSFELELSLEGGPPVRLSVGETGWATVGLGDVVIEAPTARRR